MNLMPSKEMRIIITLAVHKGRKEDYSEKRQKAPGIRAQVLQDVNVIPMRSHLLKKVENL